MKIYSIKEIVDATNSLLKSKSEKTLKENFSTKEKEIKVEVATKPIEIKLSPLNKKKEISLNKKIQIKPKVRDLIVNELYIFLKKKFRKNTLKTIVDK